MKPYNELTTEEKLACISLYPEAKKDKYNYIRLEAHRAMGYTEEARKDEYWLIRQEAELYFKIKNS